jgi:hypothetical protein
MIRGKQVSTILRALILAAAGISAGVLLENQAPAQQKSAASGEQTMEGIVTDAICGTKHKNAIITACIKACVDKGSNYGLVVDDKVYELEAKGTAVAKLAELANVKAKVIGRVTGSKIAVTSVAEPTFQNYNAGG